MQGVYRVSCINMHGATYVCITKPVLQLHPRTPGARTRDTDLPPIGVARREGIKIRES